MGLRILVVDDSGPDRLACRRVLEARAWRVTEAETPEAALAALAGEPFHAVLSDFNLKSAMDGIDVLEHALRHHPGARRILMSGFSTPGVVERARERAQIHAWLEKPMSPKEWPAELDRALSTAVVLEE